MANHVAEYTVLVENWLKAEAKLTDEQGELARRTDDLKKEEADLRKKLDQHTADSERIQKSLKDRKISLTLNHVAAQNRFATASGKQEEDLLNTMVSLLAKSKEIDALLEQLSGSVGKTSAQGQTLAISQPMIASASQSQTSNKNLTLQALATQQTNPVFIGEVLLQRHSSHAPSQQHTHSSHIHDSQASDPKHNQQTPGNRSKTGCQACRARKKACDGRHPTCENYKPTNVQSTGFLTLPVTSAVTSTSSKHLNKGIQAEDPPSLSFGTASTTATMRGVQHPLGGPSENVNFEVTDPANTARDPFIVPGTYVRSITQQNLLKRKAVDDTFDAVSQDTIPNVSGGAALIEHKALQDVAINTLSYLAPHQKPRKLRMRSFNVENMVDADDEGRMSKGTQDTDGEYVPLQG